ncbi:MAG: TrmH family RNA methyltransferase [Clostridiales bacterium]|nr:TrmH family RNA methyltransferase [Clostridiales bacterium]
MNIKKYSKEDNYSFTFGGFPTYELLKQKTEKVREIIIHEKLTENTESKKILELAKKNRIPITTNGKLIEKLSGKGNVFIVGVFEKYSQKINHEKNQILLVNPSDMGNLGTIIRVALGFGYDNIAIIKPCIDIFDPKVIRASMGAIFNINIEMYNSLDDYLKVNKNHKYPFMLQAKQTLQNLITKHIPHTLIFGNESSGLDSNYLNIGTPLIIKHSNLIDSLNLSMSVGIALYEFTK